MKFMFITMLPFSRYTSYKRATGMGDELAKDGHEVWIAALDCAENRRRLQVEAPHCTPLWFGTGNAFKEVWAKLKHIWRIKPDYVFVPTYGLRNLMGSRMFFPRRSKLLLEINELHSSFQPHHRWFWKFMEWFGMVESDYQVCASTKLMEYIEVMSRKWCINRKTIYLPYAYPSYLKTRPRRSDARRRIVFMATLYEYFGVYEVIEAFKLLADSGLSVSLDVIGGGPELENVREKVRAQGYESSIRVLGYVAEEQLDGYFSQADVFVAPMRDTKQDWYRCPSKLFYYLAYDRPIVTCKIGNPFETLGDYGFYYKPMDALDMSCAIKRALEDGHFHYPPEIVRKHSWGARAMQLVDFLNE